MRQSRRLAAVAVAAMAAAGLSPATPAAAVPVAPVPAPPPATPTVGESVASTLATAAGPHAMPDDSSASQCLTGGAEWVAYRTDRIVLRTGLPPHVAENRVQAAIGQVQSTAPVTGTEVINLPSLPGGGNPAPVTVVSFDASADEVPIVSLARRLRAGGIPASPDYLLSPSSGPTAFWPGGGPRPASTPATPRAAGIGDEVTILIYDVGLPPPSQSAHPPNASRLTAADTEQLDQVAPFGEVDIYHAGHAMPMSGIIHTIAPAATVKVARITGDDGVATDVTAARRMANTLRQAHQQDNWPDVIVNAFGSPACDLYPNQPGARLEPLGLAAVTEAVDRHGQALLVASAGNRATDLPYYPAAFDEPAVVAIGALETAAGPGGSVWAAPSRSGPAAAFSNYGSWVTGWAPGVDLPAHHVDGFRFTPDGPVIKGLALVDGTSFAAPLVAALVAEVIADQGVDPVTAWDLIAAAGTPCSAAVGGGVAVALVDMAGSATTPAAGNPTALC